MSDEVSKSTGGGGESDWADGAEEVVGKQRGGGGSGSPPSSQTGTQLQPPAVQHTSPAAGSPSDIQPQAETPAPRAAGVQDMSVFC